MSDVLLKKEVEYYAYCCDWCGRTDEARNFGWAPFGWIRVWSAKKDLCEACVQLICNQALALKGTL